MQVTQSLLDGLAEAAREHGRLGLDTEFMPEGRYRPLLPKEEADLYKAIHMDA